MDSGSRTILDDAPFLEARLDGEKREESQLMEAKRMVEKKAVSHRTFHSVHEMGRVLCRLMDDNKKNVSIHLLVGNERNRMDGVDG